MKASSSGTGDPADPHQEEPTDHAGYFHPDSSWAVMPADSWHQREPKITQTAGATGCPGPKHWAGSQDTWNPILAEPVVAS